MAHFRQSARLIRKPRIDGNGFLNSFRRGCQHAVSKPRLRIARRDRLAGDLGGDLLQAGPLLLAEGEHALLDGEDREGFSAAAHQFDSDITRGRYPRAALAIAGGLWFNTLSTLK